ncbi:C39 family peptidase [Olsenella profusa]|uniref:C39 family peptidase n=1 Tax=Olsenella profusa TaxID=138595 RepID=A0ABS2F3E6_9ACTN|nr:C39 family peptidase [Olsenella profusa]MBM6775511.1 C39 family peptidase [Olsenella profusa]
MRPMRRTPRPDPSRMRIAPARYARRRRRHVRAPLVLLAAAMALTVAWVTWAALSLTGEADRAGSTGSGEPAASDPRPTWRAGEVPRLYQTDPAWAELPYAGGTIAKNGCGPTCLAMAYVALTGRTDRGPAEVAAFAERGGYVADGMTTWALMTEGAAALGLSSEELPADEASVRAALADGRPVICSMRPGDFTTTGHFIVLARLDADGRVVVRDPNSAERTAQTWDLDRVLDQCANLWALSA